MAAGRGTYKSMDELRGLSDEEVTTLYQREWKNYRRRMERMRQDPELKNSPVVLAYLSGKVVSYQEAKKSGMDVRMELNQLLRESNKKTTEMKYARRSLEIQVQYYKEK